MAEPAQDEREGGYAVTFENDKGDKKIVTVQATGIHGAKFAAKTPFGYPKLVSVTKLADAVE